MSEQGRNIPGFGGYHFNRDGDMVVYLTDLSRADLAIAQLSPVLAARPRSVRNRGQGPMGPVRHRDAPSILVRQGRFTYQELRDWRDAIFSRVFATPGVTMLAVSVPHNAILIGVNPNGPPSATAEVERILDAAAVPRDAALIHPASPLVEDVKTSPRPTVPRDRSAPVKP